MVDLRKAAAAATRPNIPILAWVDFQTATAHQAVHSQGGGWMAQMGVETGLPQGHRLQEVDLAGAAAVEACQMLLATVPYLSCRW